MITIAILEHIQIHEIMTPQKLLDFWINMIMLAVINDTLIHHLKGFLTIQNKKKRTKKHLKKQITIC